MNKTYTPLLQLLPRRHWDKNYK